MSRKVAFVSVVGLSDLGSQCHALFPIHIYRHRSRGDRPTCNLTITGCRTVSTGSVLNLVKIKFFTEKTF